MTAERSATRSEGLRIFRNSAILGVGSAAGMALGFVTTILVTDALGEGYGLLLSAQRFVGFFTVIVDFGLATLLVRAIAAREDTVGSLTGTVVLLRCALGAVYGCAAAIAAFTLDYLPGYRWLLAAFLAMEFLGQLAEAFSATCQGLEAMGRATVIALARSVVTCAGVLVVYATGGGLPGVMTMYFAGRTAQLAVAVWMARAAAPGMKLSVRFDRMLPLLRTAFLFLAVIIGYGALRSVDVVMLNKLATVKEVARYGAALNFIDVLLAVPLLVQTALLPAFTRLTTSGSSSAIGRHTLQAFSAAVLPAAVGLAILAERAVALYPSGEFSDSASVLRLLASGFCFLSLASVSATLLTGAGRLRVIVAGYVFAVASQAAVNFALIPSRGALGAAAGTVTAYVVLAVFLLAALRRIGVEVPFGAILCHAVSAAVMGAVVYATRGLPLPVPVALGGIVYVAALLLISSASSLERRLVAEVMARLRRKGEPGLS
jgi:O-antigen/teichoic acid export membrane protein